MKCACETVDSAEGVIVRVFDQHLGVLLQPEDAKNLLFYHVFVRKRFIVRLTEKRTAGGA